MLRPMNHGTKLGVPTAERTLRAMRTGNQSVSGYWLCKLPNGTCPKAVEHLQDTCIYSQCAEVIKIADIEHTREEVVAYLKSF
jgi:hypothetical protein